MRKMGLGFMIAGVLIGMSAARADSGEVPLPTLVTVSPKAVFAPPGFDNNDNAQIVLAGYFQNTCFKAGPASASVDVQRREIRVKYEAFFHDSCWCLFVEVPFQQTVDLGMLPAGEYKILSEAKNGTFRAMGTLPVAVSTNSGPDDELYAVASDAWIDETANGRDKILNVSGTLTSSCMELKETRVLYRTADVIEVLPVIQMRQGDDCVPMNKPFRSQVRIQASEGGRKMTLIHVRSLNGQAVNKVIEL